MDQLWDPFSEVCRDVYCAADLEFVECECRGTPTNSRYTDLAVIGIMPTNSRYTGLVTIRIMPTNSRYTGLATIRIMPTNSRYTALATIRIMPADAGKQILPPSGSCPPRQIIRSCHHTDHALQFQVIRFATIRIMPSNSRYTDLATIRIMPSNLR